MDQVICDALRQELDAQIAMSPGFRWGNTLLAGQPITMEDLLAETAITYPEAYVQEMSGERLKAVLEDVCDNLFNADPFYQQGGDMVRVGGLDYACAPGGKAGRRISAMTLDDGRPIEPGKTYRVAGWASVNEQTGAPVWEIAARYLRREKTVRPKRINRVLLKGVAKNPGIYRSG
jgi:sulfur-oxidizing protein SoxB